MAKEVGPDYIIMDASSQYEGWAHRAQTPVPVLSTKFYVKDITAFGGGGGGAVHITETDSGKTVLPSFELAADEEQNYPINRYVEGLWAETIDAGVKVQFNLGYY